MRFRDLSAYAQPLEAELGCESDVPASSVCVGGCFFHPAPLGKMNLWRACPYRPVLPWGTTSFSESEVSCRVLVPLIVPVFSEVQEVPKAVDTEEESSEEGGSLSLFVSSRLAALLTFYFLLNCNLNT